MRTYQFFRDLFQLFRHLITYLSAKVLLLSLAFSLSLISDPKMDLAPRRNTEFLCIPEGNSKKPAHAMTMLPSSATGKEPWEVYAGE